MKKIKVGIIGGSGYTAGELIRILYHHPCAEIKCVYSGTHQGKTIAEIHKDMLYAELPLFSKTIDTENIDVLFSCLPHGVTQTFLQKLDIPNKVKIIDLSNDFRLAENNQLGYRTFVYGSPECNREKIKKASSVANPGCFATAINLALYPAVKHQIIHSDIHVSGITGSTGAGRELRETTHFSWRNNNVSFYKEFTHQHNKEIYEAIHSLHPNNAELFFLPIRGNFTRGILASIYFDCPAGLEEANALYTAYYDTHPFVSISHAKIDVKQVVNTNQAFLNVQKIGDKLLITSIIDNLVKGAAGQAVQNMNLMLGLDENAGLELKPSAY